jgi:hypothetical protein
MSLHQNLLSTLLAATVALATTFSAQDAHACGGFFCNANNQVPIYQAGERIVFRQHDDGIDMHIEITFSGAATDFGWLMPIIDAPTDEEGNIRPLEDFLKVSNRRVFDQLQSRTNPIFSVDNTILAETCPPAFNSSEGEGDFDSFEEGGETGEDGGEEGGMAPPPVVVLEEANIGPFDAQLVKATDSDALFAWLNENGYLQDELARPVLDHYVANDYVFVGLRLQSGASTGELKPVSLHLGEAAPCVPLKLTGIAATDNMPIMVFVLGEERAIPKNFMHAIVNDAAIAFPSASNYFSVVNEAIDTLNGHAWVTEFAGDVDGLNLKNQFSTPKFANVDAILAAKDLKDLLQEVKGHGISSNDYMPILQAEVGKPEGLTGYPFGNCYYNGNIDDAHCNPHSAGECCETEYYGCIENSCFDNAGHLTTDAEFFNYLDHWVTELDKEGVQIPVSLPDLKNRIIKELVDPLVRIQDMVDASTKLTRFYTTQSAHEMTKDPIFAYNADLPDVSRTHTVETIVQGICAQEAWVDATYSSGQTWSFGAVSGMFSTPSLPPVPGAPALLYGEVLDEWGYGQPLDAQYAGIVDGWLEFAQIGEPSLPGSLKVPEPEETDSLVDSNVPSDSVLYDGPRSGGCAVTNSPSGSPLFPMLVVFGTLGLLGIIRKRRMH